MLARLPWTQPAPVRAKPKKLHRDRRQHLVRVVATILAMGEPTKFTFEATCRHVVRSRLCLAGWRWADADDTAAGIVSDALRRLGAQRPSWKEGQPEWTQDGFSPTPRIWCVRCRTRLPEGHWKFCGHLCAQAHFDNQARIQASAEGEAYDLVAQRLAKWKRGDAAG